MKPTLDDLRKLAEAAKAWRPEVGCDLRYIGTGEYVLDENCGKPGCNRCLGAKRAAEDVERLIDDALLLLRPPTASQDAADLADRAARIESYYQGPGPVAEFAAAVREFCS